MSITLKTEYLVHLKVIEQNLPKNPSELHDFLVRLFEDIDWKAVLAQDGSQREIRTVVGRLIQHIPNQDLQSHYRNILAF